MAGTKKTSHRKLKVPGKVSQLMKLIGPLLFIMLMVGVLYHTVSADRTFRCKGHIISLGDKSTDVAAKCGPPEQIKQWEEGSGYFVRQFYDYKHERYAAPKHIGGPVKMARWTYNLGPNKFLRYLYFQNGELIRIKTGAKGSD